MKPAAVLAASGALGFMLGAFRFPSWQVAVESSQVVAGIVQYPPGNPFYVYHTKLWTVLHQLGALLLMSGMSEILLSRILSGLVGATSFAALSMIAYAPARNGWLAVLSSLVIFLSGAAEQWDVYPVLLMGTTHTYGSLGLSVFVLAIGLFGAGLPRAAAFLTGLAPAIHPVLGAFLWMALGAAIAWQSRRDGIALRPAAGWFAAGCAVTTASLVVQLVAIADVPPGGAPAARRALEAFAATWDFHRAPVRMFSRTVVLNTAALVVSMALLVRMKSVPPAARFMLRAVVTTAALSLASVPLSWVPPARLPSSVVIAMPSRLLIVNVVALPALVVGLAGSLRSTFVARRLAVALLAAMLVWRAPLVIQRAAWDTGDREFRNYSNDPLLAAAAAEKRGLLVTGGSLHLIQLVTRRPVLLDGGALDTLPYAVEAGPEMQRILEDVYGIDLFNPPPEARRTGVIPHERNKAAWEAYTSARWAQIGRTHNVTQVITDADWSLNLPVVAVNRELRLYRIPE